MQGLASLAGSSFFCQPNAPWIMSLPEDQRPEDYKTSSPVWSESSGDRHTELVVIGVGMDKEAVRSKFQECVLTDEEFALGPLKWQFENPFLEEWEELLQLGEGDDEEDDDEEDDEDEAEETE